ncbi:MAG TPA: cation:dicarboxylase symporter family transporter [Rhabdochlamydiaceae bacterium]
MLALFRSSLTLQMIIATLLGIFVGLFLGDLCHVFAPWENAYIMILKITTIPYLICAVIHGIGRLATGAAKQILQKGLLFIAGIWVINIGIIYMTVFLFPHSHGAVHSSYSTLTPSTINFAELLIPDNVFYALSNNLVPAVVMFGLLLGIALMHLREKQTVLSFLDTLVEAFTRMTGWISRITPLGTFLIIADRVGMIQVATVKQISTYLILYILCICLLVFWIIPRIVAMLTGLPATKWIKDLTPILVLAFTTNVVIVTLPFIIELIKRESERLYKKDVVVEDQVQGIVSIIFNLPLGSLFITVFVFFISIFYHMPLSFMSQVQLFVTTFLTSLGAVGLGSWINSLNFLLDSLGLPLNAIDTYLTTLPFTAGFQSLVSVMEISSLGLLIALACHGVIQWDWRNVAKKTAMTLIPVVVFFFVFKSWVMLPSISNPTKSICDVQINTPIKVKVYTEKDAPPAPRTGETFTRVLQSKVLRVGYNPEMIPFSFQGSNRKIIGYDMSFAYMLAHDLQCDLELVPVHFGRLAEELNTGLYDVAMTGVSITEPRLKKMCFSHPYLDSRMVFLMRKKFSHTYTSLEDILKHPHVKLVVRKGSSYETLARSLVPDDQIATIDNYEEYVQNYPNDVLFRGQPQSIAWSLNYPNFTVVMPKPEIAQDSLGYAVALGSDQMLCYLNQWLTLKKNERFTQHQYDLWILGKTEIETPQPRRWSIIRDVLGWTDN